MIRSLGLALLLGGLAAAGPALADDCPPKPSGLVVHGPARHPAHHPVRRRPAPGLIHAALVHHPWRPGHATGRGVLAKAVLRGAATPEVHAVGTAAAASAVLPLRVARLSLACQPPRAIAQVVAGPPMSVSPTTVLPARFDLADFAGPFIPFPSASFAPDATSPRGPSPPAFPTPYRPPNVVVVGYPGIPRPGAVPEPETWALMILGFFGVGAARRTARRRATRNALTIGTIDDEPRGVSPPGR